MTKRTPCKTAQLKWWMHILYGLASAVNGSAKQCVVWHMDTRPRLESCGQQAVGSRLKKAHLRCAAHGAMTAPRTMVTAKRKSAASSRARQQTMGAFVAPLVLGARTCVPKSSTASRSLPLCASPAPASVAQCAPLVAADTPHPEAAAARAQVVVVWFRSDLRLHDNPCLTGIEDCAIAPLLVLDQDARQSVLDAAHDLRDALRARGCELFVRRATNDVAAVVSQFCSSVGAHRLHFSAGVSRQQIVLEERVKREVAAVGTHVATFWSGGLFSPEQLPFAVPDMPEDCDAFANAVRTVRVDEPLPVPDSFRPVSGVESGHIPGCFKGCGGEKVGMCGLDEYCKGGLAKVEGAKLQTSFKGRLEPFLEMGCVSSRLLWKRVVASGEMSLRRYCAEIELLLFEFKRFMMLKNGALPA